MPLQIFSLLVLCVLGATGCGHPKALPPAPQEQARIQGRTLEQWRDLLSSSSRSDRVHAIRHLHHFGSDALGDLARALEDVEGGVRTAALGAIGLIAPQELVWSQQIAQHLANTTGGEPTAAATALTRIGPAAIPALAPLLDSDDERVRQRMALVLSGLPATEDARALWIGMASDTSWIVRQRAARGLAAPAGRDQVHLDAIETLLTDNVPGVQEAAADAAGLSVQASPTIHAALVGLLDSPHGKVRGAAAEALGHTQDPEVVKRLERLARDETNAHARVRAALGHWRCSGDVAVVRATLRSALDHRRTEVRRLALRCIGEMGTAAGPLVEEVAQRLNDRALRIAAIESLESLGPAAQAAVPALQRLRTHSRPYTTQRIDAALERIGG